ncbi:MAG: ERCC4 domain-containing protein [Euryarchaeota archaeon]|nr:ERCC4 domain-containing protein [Euryarchaeota archaeon]MDE1879475.1 ERCC4 domain-containing protein [Euryarchaeota archaeon]
MDDAELDTSGLATVAPDDWKPIALPPDSPVLVDSREPDAIAEILAAKGAYPVVQTLKDEDYVVAGVHVHRKTVTDLIHSSENNHLRDELSRLLPYTRDVHLIVEDSVQHKWTDLGRAKALCRRLNIYLPVTRTKDLEETAEALLWIRKMVVEGTYHVLGRRPVILNHNVPPVAEHYASLPGVGAKLAVLLAEKYPIPVQFYRAVEETYQYDPKRWKTRRAWREARWDAGVEGIAEGKAGQVAAAVLMGAFE